ncbi:MAG: protein kinase [Labilithrix sp.]|nr:protein kinase [Labilithrix sp.]
MSDDDIDSLLRNVGRAPPRPLDARWVDDGRYRLGEPLGEGSFGTVYEAYDRERDETVALKILRRSTSDALLRFKREFRVLSELSDASFVRLYDLHGEGERWYFTMERVEGVPFDAWVRDPYRLRSGFESLFAALARLHARGLVHRDLKPSNVLVDRQGRVVLLDFGLMHALDDGGSTAMGGTPAYVAPEILAGMAPTPASDWYAAGVMLYEALTGELPFAGSAEAILREKQAREAPAVRAPHAPDDLARLCERLLRARPEERAVDLAPRAPKRSSFVGRQRELHALFDALDEAREKRAAVVVRVRGPSGVGKSSLVQRFAAEARSGDAHVLVGRCNPNDHVPFVALDGLVDALSRMVSRMPASRAATFAPRDAGALVRAFPVLAALPGFSGAKSAEWSRGQVGAALRELLQRIGEPWVLAIDDAQWGDADSAAVLEEMLSGLALCLVLVERSDAGEALLADRSARALDLRALDVSEARALAVATLGEPHAAVDVDEIVTDSGGHPLFVVEMARDRAADPSRALRRSLRDIVLGRFEALSPEGRACACLLAAAERPVELSVLRHAGIHARAVDELRERGLVVSHDAESVRVHHDRLREVIAETIEPARARELHRDLAGALVALRPERAERAAFHLERAGDETGAIEQLVRAARHASSARAFARARAIYDALLLLRARQRRGDDLEIDLRVERAEVIARLGRSVEAAEAFLGASRLASADRALLLRVRAAEQLLTSGHLERGEKILDEQLRRLGISTPSNAPGRLFGVARDAVGGRVDRWRTEPASEARLIALWSAYRASIGVQPLRALGLGSRLVREAARPGADAYHRLAAAVVDALAMVVPRGPDALPRGLARLALAAGARAEPEIAQLYTFGEALVRYFGLEIREAAAAFDRLVRINVEHGLGRGAEETPGRSLRSSCAWVLGDVDHLRRNVGALCLELEERDHLAGWVLCAMHRMWITLLKHGPGQEVDAQLDEVRRRWVSRGLELQGWWLDMAHVLIALIRGDARTAWRLSHARPYRERVLASLMHRLEAQTLLARAAVQIGLRDPSSREVAEARRVTAALARVPSAWTRAHATALEASLSSLSPDRGATLRALRAARPAAEDAGMPLLKTLLELAEGRVLGGDQGALLVRGSEETLRAWDVDRDVALTSTLPGRW